jgi:hypothetical protein
MGKQNQIGDALVAPIESKGYHGKLRVVGLFTSKELEKLEIALKMP